MTVDQALKAHLSNIELLELLLSSKFQMALYSSLRSMRMSWRMKLTADTKSISLNGRRMEKKQARKILLLLVPMSAILTRIPLLIVLKNSIATKAMTVVQKLNPEVEMLMTDLGIL